MTLPLRILHLSNDVYPVVTGGTEIFIWQLITEQNLDHRTQPYWASHARDHTSYLRSIETEDPSTIHLPPIPQPSRSQLVSAISKDILAFRQLLIRIKPHILHLHSLSPRCGLTHILEASRLNIRVVITIHDPAFHCIKGNLINRKNQICDGVLDTQQCTQCRLQNSGVPSIAANILARKIFSQWPINSTSKFLRLLSSYPITQIHHQTWIKVANTVDSIHVLARWQSKILINHPIDTSKILYIPTAGPSYPADLQRPILTNPLRLVYWGRFHPVKGIHMVVQALLDLPTNVNITLDLFGPYWDSDYGHSLENMIDHDDRINYCGNIGRDHLLKILPNYSYSVVPSLWLETGPLTIMESFSVGLPVIGNNIGGINELLSDLPNCHLVEPHQSAWRSTLISLSMNPGQLVFIPPPPRTFRDLHLDLYRSYMHLKP